MEIADPRRNSKICVPFIKIQIAYATTFFILPKRVWEQFAYFRVVVYDRRGDKESHEPMEEISIVFTNDYTSLWEFIEDMKHPIKYTIDTALQIKESCSLLGLDEFAPLRGKLMSLFLCAASNCASTNWELDWALGTQTFTISQTWQNRALFKRFCVETLTDKEEKDPRSKDEFLSWFRIQDDKSQPPPKKENEEPA